MNMKKILAICLAASMSIGITACKQSTPTQGGDASKKPIKIGLTTVLTGDRSLEGEYAKNGAKIIQKEINDAGGVLGRPIEIVIEDALGTDVGAVNAYRKLANDPNVVAIIGSDSSNDNMAVSPAASELKIPTTAQGSSPKLRDMANSNPYLFQLRACDQTLIESLIKYAVEKGGYKKFAIVHDTETSSTDQARIAKETLAKLGLEPVVVVPFTTGTKDFTSHITQIQKSGADAVFGGAFQAEAAILVQQIRSLGMKDIPIFGSNAFADPVTIRLAGDAVNGVYCAAAWVPNTPNPKGAALAKKYKELYKEDCGKAAAQVYDHVSIIVEAIKRAGTTDRAKVRDAMNTIDNFDGAITRYDLRTNGDAGRGGLLVKVEKQIPTVLEAITSEKVIKK
jgi:branched-chain amino acid transport system substrate-binding protein